MSDKLINDKCPECSADVVWTKALPNEGDDRFECTNCSERWTHDEWYAMWVTGARTPERPYPLHPPKIESDDKLFHVNYEIECLVVAKSEKDALDVLRDERWPDCESPMLHDYAEARESNGTLPNGYDNDSLIYGRHGGDFEAGRAIERFCGSQDRPVVNRVPEPTLFDKEAAKRLLAREKEREEALDKLVSDARDELEAIKTQEPKQDSYPTEALERAVRALDSLRCARHYGIEPQNADAGRYLDQAYTGTG